MKNPNEFYITNPLLEKRARFIQLKSSIEFKSAHTQKPSIEISDLGLSELSSIEKGVADITSDGHTGLVAVMRGWNLDSQTVNDITQRMNKIKECIPALKGIFFVINGDGEINNITEESLRGVIQSGKNQMPIAPIKVYNYTWTAGLNSAAAIMNEIALDKQIDRDKIKMLNISYGVSLEQEELLKCKKSVEDDRFIMTIRNTDNQGLTAEKQDNELLWDKFKQLLRNPNDADLGYALRSMRNTFNIFTLSDIVKYGGFNPATVPLGSMEDADFLMRMILNALKSGNTEMIREFKKALTNPIAYTDQRWLELKHKKDPSETAALKKILSGMAIGEKILNNNYGISEDEQDFRMRS